MKLVANVSKFMMFSEGRLATNYQTKREIFSQLHTKIL